jgi:hypothetical protein
VFMLYAQGGDTTAFRLEMMRAGVAGPVSPLSVVALSDGTHAYHAEDGSLMTFDGRSVAPLGGWAEQARIQRAILDSRDFQHRDEGWSLWDRDRGVLWLVYPQRGTGKCSGGLCIDVASNSVWPFALPDGLELTAGLRGMSTVDTLIGDLTMAIGDIPGTLADMTTEAPALVMATADSYIVQHEGATDLVGNVETPITATLETKLHSAEDPSLSTTVLASRHIFERTDHTTTLKIAVGVCDAAETPEYHQAADVELMDRGVHEVGHRVTGRFFSLKLEVTASEVVRWIGSALAVALRGRR